MRQEIAQSSMSAGITYANATEKSYCGVRLRLSVHALPFGVVNVNFSDFFEFSTVNATRGHAYKLYKSRCSLLAVVAVDILQKEL